MNRRAPLRFHPRLIEEAVFLSLKNDPQAGAFHRERNRLYEIADADKREQAFLELHRSWFVRLALARPIEQAVDEQSSIASQVRLCAVGCAGGKKEEGAELFVSSDPGMSEMERRSVQILLRPESLLEPGALLEFLRHELFHIADMLDPHFGYEPVLPAAEGGPTHDCLLKERYRVLWDATIDGRMARRGWAEESGRTERLRDFCRAFPMFGEENRQVFSRFFDHEPHTHAELVEFALNPTAAVRDAVATSQPGSRCPLCGFPTHVFEPTPECLPAPLTTEIAQDFPLWQPGHGLCTQCADLYRSNAAPGAGTQDRPPGGTPAKVVLIVGRKKTGKTTLIEKLIPELSSRGYRVGTIKHHHSTSPLEVDRPGKDSWRHRTAGAKAVALISPSEVAVFRSLNRTVSLDEIVEDLKDVDLVLVEGLRSEPKPRIEIRSSLQANSSGPKDGYLLAVVGSGNLNGGIPCFSPNDIQALADLIEKQTLGQTPTGYRLGAELRNDLYAP